MDNLPYPLCTCNIRTKYFHTRPVSPSGPSSFNYNAFTGKTIHQAHCKKSYQKYWYKTFESTFYFTNEKCYPTHPANSNSYSKFSEAFRGYLGCAAIMNWELARCSQKNARPYIKAFTLIYSTTCITYNSANCRKSIPIPLSLPYTDRVETMPLS